jgi:hypothetical protein
MTIGSTLVLILISIAIGFLIGALIYGLRSRPSATRPAKLGEDVPPECAVSLWRDPQTQNLSVQMEDKIYRQAGELTPEMRGRLARLARDWQLWLGMPSSRLATLAAPSAEPGDAPDLERDNRFEQIQSGRSSGAAPPAAGQAGQPAPAAAIGAASASPAQPINAGPQSIAGQIDEILQARLENTPLAERGIQLVELPDQGLVVKVGQAQYTDLTQVPDPEVRAVIAESVAEWEKRAGPKASG